MKNYQYIMAKNDKFGNRQVLWSHGNYIYEIEDRTAQKSVVFEADFEDAKSLFEAVCVSY